MGPTAMAAEVAKIFDKYLAARDRRDVRVRRRFHESGTELDLELEVVGEEDENSRRTRRTRGRERCRSVGRGS